MKTIRTQSKRTRYGTRLYSIRQRIDALGIKQVPSKLDRGGYWKSQTKIRNTQYFVGTLMDDSYLVALDKFVTDLENESC